MVCFSLRARFLVMIVVVSSIVIIVMRIGTWNCFLFAPSHLAVAKIHHDPLLWSYVAFTALCFVLFILFKMFLQRYMSHRTQLWGCISWGGIQFETNVQEIQLLAFIWLQIMIRNLMQALKIYLLYFANIILLCSVYNYYSLLWNESLHLYF